ncbi:SRPBCC domain-containing protein [Chamaesiphon sp. OTE_75_metabat_556]|uniref:SRPBCC domain-containing protein n=1 Tax=Chamaesiphon sp. OTE_75_metabat_556 TaxID=2964692 RepID=UPI00286D5A35|nr:SRPBCC domain-containing protein [Chamaesiphon sp. OTE_75_metabat_556]
MARQLITSIEIDASPNVVWEILTEFDRFDLWNPFIRSIDGKAKIGTKLKVKIQPPGGSAMIFRPVVLAADPNKELRWLGRVILPGIFDGEHRFQVEPLGDRRVRFVQSEKFSGLLVPFFWRSLNIQTRRGFEEMNQALKLRSEQQ